MATAVVMAEGLLIVIVKAMAGIRCVRSGRNGSDGGILARRGGSDYGSGNSVCLCKVRARDGGVKVMLKVIWRW